MAESIDRRTAIGMGAVAAAVATLTVGPGRAVAAPIVAPAAPTDPAGVRPSKIRTTYFREKARAGGAWHAHIAIADGKGGVTPLVEDDADRVTYGYSVQKLAVATAVLDKVDRGELDLGQRLDLPADLILGGSGIYHLHTVWADEITIANFLTAMLLMSDNTAVRMCGRVAPALEINQILAAKGFLHTRVEPVANPNRFYLGTTTPRETHDLLWRLASKTLLSPNSCEFMLGVIRWVNGYHDGVRRDMSSNERARVATKYGADFDEFGAARHEAGVMFGADGTPALTYALFADALGDNDNYGATHPAVLAHAVLGRVMFDAIASTTGPAGAARHDVTPFRPVNGG